MSTREVVIITSGMNTVYLGRVEQGQTSFSSTSGKPHSGSTVVLCTVFSTLTLLGFFT